jgi:hypothetical protein
MRLKMNWKRGYWGYSTAIIVALIAFNPEMIHLATFIDAVGLELVILLIEVQVIAIFWNYLIGPLKRLVAIFSLKSLFEMNGGQPRILTFMSSIPATLMHVLVLTMVLGLIFNIQ